MKRRAIATTAIAALLVLGAVSGTLAFSMARASGASAHTPSSMTALMSTHAGGHEDNNTSENNSTSENDNGQGQNFNLTVGEKLTFSNLTGHWIAFTQMPGEDDHGNDSSPMGVKSGNATGSFTFTVTSHSSDGYNLTISSGSFTINGTTYTVSSGHLALNEGGESGFGSGTASGGATFEIHVAGIHGNTTSAAMVGAIKLDVKVGQSGYLVILGSHEGVAEDNESESD